jgi:hypothetical protein
MEIDLLNPERAAWELIRPRAILITLLKAIALLFVLPGAFIGMFVVFYKIGEDIRSHILLAIVVAGPLLLWLALALLNMAYDRFLGSEAVSYQGAVLANLFPMVLVAIVSLIAYLVAGLGLLDGANPSHTLADWGYFYYLLCSPVSAMTHPSPIPLHGWLDHTIAGLMSMLLLGIVYPSVVSIFIQGWRGREVFAGTQLELWAYLMRPVFWFEDFTIRQMNSDLSFQRKPFVKVGGLGYSPWQLWRYLKLTLLLPYRTLVCGNRPHTRRVYKKGDDWAINRLGTSQNIPFLSRMPDMLEMAVGIHHIPNAGQGFTLIFSDGDFFGASIRLERGVEGEEWVQYRWKPWGLVGSESKHGEMFKPLLQEVFKHVPAKIYAQAVKDAPDESSWILRVLIRPWHAWLYGTS